MTKGILTTMTASMAGLMGQMAVAAPKAELWDFWSQSDEASTQVVSHESWDGFLKKYIAEQDGINLMAYGAVSGSDKKLLKDYLRELADARPRSLNRQEQLAYWINMYNALTVDLILDNHPVESIRDISPGLFAGGPWDDELVTVEGESLTLNDIEHRILRPIWQDPRLHYAVNCASLGCPNLATDAYTAQNSERLLDAGAKAYVNHPRGVFVTDSGALRVSSIYEWFKEDFGGTDASVIEHLKKHAESILKEQMASISSIDDDDYDWSLNEK